MEEGEEGVFNRQRKDMIGLREMKQVKHEGYKETEPASGCLSMGFPNENCFILDFQKSFKPGVANIRQHLQP